MNHIHVIGAGLAGLAAALALTEAGRTVTVHEASAAAGGRCRSYFDRELGLRIDNGNHLILSGNRATHDYIDEIGTNDRFTAPARAAFPFVDLNSDIRWTLRPSAGRIPWWVLRSGSRIPETKLSDYWELARIGRVKDDRTVAEAVRRGRLYWRMVEPLAIAALNTRPQYALVRLLGAVMRETLLRGGRACIPMFPRGGLSEALVDPAVALLRERGAEVLFNRRISGLTMAEGRITAIAAADGPIALDGGDGVVLAVPPWAAGELVPDLIVPNEFESILNIHYALDAAPTGPVAEAGFIGVLGGAAEWVFVKQGHVSVTISAANHMIDNDARAIAAAVWPNVVAALGLTVKADAPIPPFRVIKEKRATITASSAQERRRPAARTTLANLALAGDWTATGLPGTIEGAIRSGRSAAQVLVGR